jgi:ComF family protein
MWLKRILTFLFPPRCLACKKEGSLFCDTCTQTLAKTPIHVTSTTWALFPYHHTIGERFIHAMKFGGKSSLSKTAGELLATTIPKILSEDKDTEHIIFVPIPTSQHEREKRGYDHVALMTDHCAQWTKTSVSPALRKIRETERQVTMKTREKRLKNLEDAFAFDPHYDLTGKTVILIDDVTTTGATFSEARRALKNSGATRILSLALAH